MQRILTCFVLLLATAAAINAQSDIASINFKNFTYPALCIGDKPENVTVKNGEFSREKQEDGYVDRFYFQVFDVAFGDLTGDGKPESVVLTVCNTGGTGNFSEGFVYTLRSGKPRLIARIPGGDRAYGGLRKASVEDGLLVVESNDVGGAGGACCPEFIITTKYTVSGGTLVKSGRPSKRPVVPTTRVTFARGMSGQTLSVQIPAGARVRYIVGAREGQRLTAIVNIDEASLRLLEDADVTPGPHRLAALLPKTGDYTIEIENTSAEAIDFTLNISITKGR